MDPLNEASPATVKFGDIMTMEERIENRDRVIKILVCPTMTRVLKWHSQGTMVVCAGACDNECLQNTIDYIKHQPILPQCWICLGPVREIMITKPLRKCCKTPACIENISLYIVCSDECKRYLRSIQLFACNHDRKVTVELRIDHGVILRRLECAKCAAAFAKHTSIYCIVCGIRIRPFTSAGKYHECPIGVLRCVCSDACRNEVAKKFGKEVCRHCSGIAMCICNCNECYYCDEVCWFEDKKHLAECKYLRSKGIIDAELAT